MAIDFNALTSTLEHTTAAGFDTATMTLCAWALADGEGENALGRIFQASEADTTPSPALFHFGGANQLKWYYDFTGGGSVDGQWTFPATDGQWNAIGVSYDRSSVANDPVARVNFADVTVTETATPVGTAETPATGYCVGNISGQTRTWDGALAHVMFFNVVLSAEEMDQALIRPGSMRRGLVLWLPMWDSSHVEDLSGSALNGTATALATRDGPPITPLLAGSSFGWRGNFTAVAAPAAAVIENPWHHRRQMQPA